MVEPLGMKKGTPRANLLSFSAWPVQVWRWRQWRQWAAAQLAVYRAPMLLSLASTNTKQL
jgi:hypothetical protein